MSCPICGKETLHAFRPFCSKRCADIDLARWMNGSYAVPSERDEDVDDELDQAVSKPVRPH